MIAYLAHKIEIKPNNVQETFLLKSCGTSRVGYNAALAIWNSEYKAGNKPTMYSVKKQLNSKKKVDFPWSYEVSKCCMEEAVIDLGKAFSKFFKEKNVGHPTFHKKGKKDSFRLNNLNFSIKKSKLKISKLAIPIKMTEDLRFKGKVLSCTISKTAGKWFASITQEVGTNLDTDYTQGSPSVGIDLGVTTLATLSEGTVFKGLRPHKTLLFKLRQLNKSLSRKVKFSQNWKKIKLKLSKLHFRIANIRKDYLHKMTTHIVRTYKVITIEDLNTSGMLKNHKLARSISDSSFNMLKTILAYKAKLYGVDLVLADRFFASSKTCSKCGIKKEKLALGTRTYECNECGLVMDRDLNASINLDKFGLAKLAAVGSTV